MKRWPGKAGAAARVAFGDRTVSETVTTPTDAHGRPSAASGAEGHRLESCQAHCTGVIRQSRIQELTGLRTSRFYEVSEELASLALRRRRAFL